jgi:hypothetical protein
MLFGAGGFEQQARISNVVTILGLRSPSGATLVMTTRGLDAFRRMQEKQSRTVLFTSETLRFADSALCKLATQTGQRVKARQLQSQETEGFCSPRHLVQVWPGCQDLVVDGVAGGACAVAPLLGLGAAR